MKMKFLLWMVPYLGVLKSDDLNLLGERPSNKGGGDISFYRSISFKFPN